MERLIKRYQITSLIAIIMFLSSLIGWGYTVGRYSRDKEQFDIRINENKNDIQALDARFNDIEHLITVNNAKLELLLEHFDITDAGQ